MNTAEIHQSEKTAEAMEQAKRMVDLDSTNLVELSRIAIRGVFSNQVSPAVAACVSEDLAWFLQERVNPDFKPDLPAVVSSMKQQPFNEEAYAVRLVEDEPKIERDTDLLVELSARVIRLVRRQDMSANGAEDITEDLYCFVRDQFDETFAPDVDRAVVNISTSIKNKTTALGDVALLGGAERDRIDELAKQPEAPQVRVGNRLVSKYTVFPN